MGFRGSVGEFLGTAGAGAELDLLIQPDGKRIGFEFKVADAPRITKSLSIARNDLGLDELFVVKPRGNGYPLEENIRVVTLVEALEFCDAIF
jgi:predicted AAA+ superfamily ATPase